MWFSGFFSETLKVRKKNFSGATFSLAIDLKISRFEFKISKAKKEVYYNF